jgi:hypothetical protein
MGFYTRQPPEAPAPNLHEAFTVTFFPEATNRFAISITGKTSVPFKTCVNPFLEWLEAEGLKPNNIQASLVGALIAYHTEGDPEWLGVAWNGKKASLFPLRKHSCGADALRKLNRLVCSCWIILRREDAKYTLEEQRIFPVAGIIEVPSPPHPAYATVEEARAMIPRKVRELKRGEDYDGSAFIAEIWKDEDKENS